MFAYSVEMGCAAFVLGLLLWRFAVWKTDVLMVCYKDILILILLVSSMCFGFVRI